MPAATPCKIRGGKYRETCRTSEARKTKNACILEADESMRKRLEGTLHKHHEDLLQGKKLIHWIITILCTNLFLCLKQWRYQMRKQQWINNVKNSRNTSMAADESQKRKRGDRWNKERRKNSSLCAINGHLSSQEFGVKASISKVQRQSRTPRWQSERWFRITRSIYWLRIIRITDDSRRSHGHYFKGTRMRRTSSWCSIRLHPGQKGRCTTVIENSKVRMSRDLESSLRTRLEKFQIGNFL